MTKETSTPFAKRRDSMLREMCAESFAEDVTGASALADLACGSHIAAANEKLRAVAQWYVLRHPKGRDPYGEPDFAAIKLTWAYYRFKDVGLLEADTMRLIREYFLGYDFQSKYTSENHMLLFHTTRYLMACAFPDEEFGRYGMMGAQLIQADSAYLLDFLSFRARQGWDEFDSGAYIAPIWESLCALNDFAPDPKVQLAARMMLNVRLGDMIADSLQGMYCGAHGRIYERHALDHQNECTYFLQDLYFGNVKSKRGLYLVEALLSKFEPEPIIEKMLYSRTTPYENKERDHAHCSTYLAPQRHLPQESLSLRKLTRVTPQYALGCVQWQDPYPPDSLAAWHTGHQQMEWDLTFAGDSTQRRIFTHHPGHNGAEGAEHGYWTGDLFCNCGSHMQVGNVVLALHDIPPQESYQGIHAHCPRALFDEMREEGNSVYVRHHEVYAMLRFTHPYRWTEEGPWRGLEIFCDGAKVAVACEVGSKADYGTFEAFIDRMSRQTFALDEASMTLTYGSEREGRLTLSKAQRLLNGQALNLAYDTYDSPYMRAEWDSGKVCFRVNGEELLCDFINWDMVSSAKG